MIISGFRGEMPIKDARSLPINYAQNALNVDIRRSRLDPFKAPLDLAIAVLANSETIYLFNPEANSGDGFWFQFSSDVNVVRGAIFDDTNLRTYYTGDGVPKFTTVAAGQSGGGPYPGAAFDLGLPVPASFTATPPGGSPPAGGQEVNASYLITFVDQFGAEGPASSPTDSIVRYDTGTVALTALPVASGSFVVNTKRIYRAEISGVYNFVAEIPNANTSFDDDIDSNLLGEPLVSAAYNAPDPAMIGLTALPNGIMMGWFDNQLCFCEAFLPHAWPIEYRISFDFDIVVAIPVPNGVVVCTTGKPYLVYGSTPRAMAQLSIDSPHTCVSKRSAVDMGEFAIYASNDGLIANGGARAVALITEKVITPEQWRARVNPSSIHAYRFDDRYLAFYDNGVTQGSFTFHPEEGLNFYDEHCECAYRDDRDGRLYIKQSTSLLAWNEGANKQLLWRSGVLETPNGQTFKVAQLDADAYPVTLEYFVDGVSKKIKTVSNNRAFRLPDLRYKRNEEIEIRSTNAVTSIQLESSMSAIK